MIQRTPSFLNFVNEPYWEGDYESKDWKEARTKLLKMKNQVAFLPAPGIPDDSLTFPYLGRKQLEEIEDLLIPDIFPDIEALNEAVSRPDFAKRFSKIPLPKSEVKKLLKLIRRGYFVKPDKEFYDKAYALMKKPKFTKKWDSIRKDFSIPIQSKCYADGEISTPDETVYIEDAKREVRRFCYNWKIRGMKGWIPIIPTTSVEARGYLLCRNCWRINFSQVKPLWCCDAPDQILQYEVYIQISKDTTDKNIRDLSPEWRWYQDSLLSEYKRPSEEQRDREWVKLYKKFKKEGIDDSEIPSKIVEYTLDHHPEDFGRNLWKDIKNLEKISKTSWGAYFKDEKEKNEFLKFMKKYGGKFVMTKGKRKKKVKNKMKRRYRTLAFKQKFPSIFNEIIIEYYKTDPDVLIKLVNEAIKRYMQKMKS